MKNFRQILTITTDKPEEFLNLSYEVEECVRRSSISEGICVVASRHTTSSVFLENDNECLHSDWLKFLNTVTNIDTSYEVDYINKGQQHLKQIIFGSSVSIPISDGKLDLGPRQYIMYGDFDGQREKYVVVKIIGE